MCDRENSLEEWCEKLIPTHRVNKELAELKAKVANDSASHNISSFQLPSLSDMKKIVKKDDIDCGNSGDFDLLQIDGMCIMHRCINKLVNKKR